MKTFFALCLSFLLAFVGAQAQAQVTPSAQKFDAKFLSSTAKDTVKVYATGVKNLDLNLGGTFQYLVITATIDRVGGTAIGGTFKLQERLNASAGYTDVANMTLSLANQATQSVTWRLPAGLYGDLRINYAGSGSGMAISKAWLGYRRQ
jgi:ABC-type phosphate transport system substrate-binding protein